MAGWSNSKVFAYSVQTVGSNVVKYGNVAGAVGGGDSYSVALYAASAMTPDNTVGQPPSTGSVLTQWHGAGSQWVVGNEVTGVYPSGGYNVLAMNGGAGGAAPTWVQNSNVVTFTSTGTPTWSNVTFSVYGDLVYDTTQFNLGFCYNYFSGLQTVASGTFTINWSGSGIATFTC